MHKAIKILIASSIFYNFAAGLFGPVYAIFVQEIGGTILTAGAAWAIYTFSVGVLLLVFGQLGDRFNKRKLFFVGRVISTIGIAGYLFVKSPIHLFAVQALLGVAVSLMNPTFEAIFSRNLQKGKETRDWSRWEGSINIVLAGAAFLGAAVAEIYGFRVLFLFMTIASGVSTLVATLLLRKRIWEYFIKV